MAACARRSVTETSTISLFIQWSSIGDVGDIGGRPSCATGLGPTLPSGGMLSELLLGHVRSLLCRPNDADD
jgi:hypothetical protein